MYLVGPNLFFHSTNALDLCFGQGPVLAFGIQRQPLHLGLCVLVGHKDVKKFKALLVN